MFKPYKDSIQDETIYKRRLSYRYPVVKVCTKHVLENGSFHCSKCNGHVKDQNEQVGAEKWNETDCTKNEAVKAFGRIRFEAWPSVTYAKYVKVKSTTLAESLIQFMIEYWGLEKPDLILSVTGGSKNFTLPSAVRKAFKIGLMKVVKSTNAWIVTGGINSGVMKIVGDAVAEEMRTNSYTFLALTNWAEVKCPSKEQIDNNRSNEMLIDYKLDRQPDTVNLDPSHSHFILLDNGTDTHGKEVTFRANLERKLTSPENKMILIVVNGGKGTLDTVDHALQKGTPILLLENSKGCVDLIIKACSHRHKPLDELIQESELATREGDIDRISRSLNCIYKVWEKNPKLINIFSLDNEEDIESAILRTFLNSPSHKIFDNLRLAIIWNYHEIARKNILTSNIVLEHSELEVLFELALKMNRVEFVELLLENGLNLDKFLTDDRFKKLYDLKTTENNRLFWYLVSFHLNKNEIEDEHELHVVLRRLVKKVIFNNLHIKFFNKKENEIAFEYPAQNLFLWALLFNRIEIAKIFWKITDHQTINALMASRLLQSIPDSFQTSDKTFEEYSKEFLDAAIGLMNIMVENSHHLISYCVLLRQVTYYNVDCLEMAIACDSKAFVSLSPVQQLFDSIWCAGMKNLNFKRPVTLAKIIISMLSLGLLAPYLLFPHSSNAYPLDEEEEDFYKACTFKSYSEPIIEGLHEETKIQALEDRKENKHKRFMRQYYQFFNAPLINFACDAFLFLVFVILFSYMMLCDYVYPVKDVTVTKGNSTEITKVVRYEASIDILLDIWILFIALEEIRQFIGCGRNAGVPLVRFMQYLKTCFIYFFEDGWNILDVFGILIYTLGTILRYSAISNANENLFTASRYILCIDLIIWFIRILYYCTFFRILGQIIQILRNMARDLLFFGILIVLASSAFGIVAESALYPNSDLDWALMKKIIHNSYWSFFGQLSIYDKLYNNDEFSDKSGTIFTFILLLFYVLVILVLMNVLIAMFNSSFTNIYSNVDVIWKFQRYYLTINYYRYPFLPPPFNIFAYIINAFISTSKEQDPDEETTKSARKNELDPLINYERQCAIKYLCSLKAPKSESNKSCDSQERKIGEIKKTMNVMLEEIANLKQQFKNEHSSL